MAELTYLQAVVIGIVQGATELFPISSLGHAILVPSLLGGSWAHLAAETTASDGSSYLAFIVALHVATAVALIVFYWKTWLALAGSFLRTIRTRRIETSNERLIWLLIIATIPVGILGLLFEHSFRTLFAKPLLAAIFLTVNGLILVGAEQLRRRSARPARQLATLSFAEAGAIGTFQTLALLAGISRSGISMVGGLVRGLSHEDATNFSFLMATPVILAAGLLKLPELFQPEAMAIRGQVVVGALVAAIAAFLSARFLTTYFETKTLTPFGIYCVVVGLLCVLRFA